MTTDYKSLTPEQIESILDKAKIPEYPGCEEIDLQITRAIEQAAIENYMAQKGQAGVPDGWKLVPVEPTEAMCAAWDDTPPNDALEERFLAAYRGMLAAAPTPPAHQDAQARQADDWRNLALQFDAHRMQAIAWLKRLLPQLPDSPDLARVRAFLSMPPLNGETVLERRIAALADQDAQVGKDAERYAWLRKALADRTKHGVSHWICSIQESRPEELDATIDAAIAEAKGKK